jgi:hypothetical protein
VCNSYENNVTKRNIFIFPFSSLLLTSAGGTLTYRKLLRLVIKYLIHCGVMINLTWKFIAVDSCGVKRATSASS